MQRGGQANELADDHGPPPGDGSAQVLLTTDRFEVHVPTPDQGHVIVDVRERRPEIVARLFDLGVSPTTLVTLLPEWEPLIDVVASERAPRA